jgi:hypothetical protein
VFAFWCHAKDIFHCQWHWWLEQSWRPCIADLAKWQSFLEEAGSTHRSMLCPCWTDICSLKVIALYCVFGLSSRMHDMVLNYWSTNLPCMFSLRNLKFQHCSMHFALNSSGVNHPFSLDNEILIWLVFLPN